MKIRVWVKTDRAGSAVDDVIELEDDLSEDDIESIAFDTMLNMVEWSYEEVRDDSKTD